MADRPRQGVVGHLLPAGRAHGEVGALGELLELGDRLGPAVQPEVGLGHRGRGDVVLAASDQQQRRPVVVVEVDRGRGVGVEVGQAGLEQHVVGAGTA